MLTVHDRLTIHEILARLDHAVDGGDWDGYIALFAEDGVLDTGWTAPVAGTAAIRAWLVANEGNTSGKRHVVSNAVIDETEEGVRATSYLTVIEREEIPRVVATALITDDLVRRGDGWAVARHTVRVDPGMMKAFAAASGA
jgi:3-phenylpropionate/cinnamic acid dioxygenase small subunit